VSSVCLFIYLRMVYFQLSGYMTSRDQLERIWEEATVV
jgi:hypothetical protein